MGQIVVQAIVFISNAIADLIQQPCGSNIGGGAGFIAEFDTWNTHAVKLVYKSLTAFYRSVIYALRFFVIHTTLG